MVGLVCVQEDKRIELCEKLRQAKQSVTSYTSAIENMKAQRDSTLSDIERFQLGLDVRSAARCHIVQMLAVESCLIMCTVQKCFWMSS